MSDKPKQWGPHASPEGLGKLRTAVATLPDQKYVSVSGSGFRAKKAGDYQEVVTFDVPKNFDAHRGVFAAQVVLWDSDYEKMADPNGYTGQEGWLIWKDKTLKKEPRSVEKEKAYSFGMHNWYSSKKNSPIITFPAASTRRWKDKDSVKREDWGNVHLDGDLILSFGGKFTRRGKVYDHSDLKDWCCVTAWYRGSGVNTRAYVAMCAFDNPSHVRVLRQVKGNGDVCMGWSLYAENETLIPSGRTLLAARDTLSQQGLYTVHASSPCVFFPAMSNESGTAFAVIVSDNDSSCRNGSLCEVKIEDSGDKRTLEIEEVQTLLGGIGENNKLVREGNTRTLYGFGYPLGSDDLRYLIMDHTGWARYTFSYPTSGERMETREVCDNYVAITETGNFVTTSYRSSGLPGNEHIIIDESLPNWEWPVRVDFRTGKSLEAFYVPMSEWWYNIHYGVKLVDYEHPTTSVPHEPTGPFPPNEDSVFCYISSDFMKMQMHPDGDMCVAYMTTTSPNYASYTFYTGGDPRWMEPLLADDGVRALRSCVFFRRKSNSTFRSSF